MKDIYRLLCVSFLYGGFIYAVEQNIAATMWLCTMALIFYDRGKEGADG